MTLDMQYELGQWYPVLSSVLSIPQVQQLGVVLGRDEKKLEPKLDKVFRAFRLTPPEKVKVIILGQDPYPGGHADGLAFSSGIDRAPYSLQIILDALNNAGYKRTKLSLDDWAQQGVLLLNTALTTTTGLVEAHINAGWRHFVDATLQHLKDSGRPLAAMAWGGHAQRKFTELGFADNSLFINVFKTNHPAAVRHGYRFAEHFTLVNKFLELEGLEPIYWADPDTRLFIETKNSNHGRENQTHH